MKLITFRRTPAAVPEPGLLQKDAVYPLAPLGYVDAESFIAAGEQALASARAAVGKQPSVPLSKSSYAT